MTEEAITPEEAEELLKELSGRFIELIKVARGAETGGLVLNNLKLILGKDWSDNVVLSKLSREQPIIVEFELRRDPFTLQQNVKTISAIKELRSVAADFGLLQAKRFIEAVMYEGPQRYRPALPIISGVAFHKQAMKDAGFIVKPV